MGIESLSKSRTDNEDNKFVNNSDGTVCVDTCSEITNSSSNPIPVEIVDGTIGSNFDLYDDISSVAGSSTATIITHVVPAATTLTLRNVYLSGTNIAEYIIKIDGTIKAKARTYWGDFDRNLPLQGIEATAGQVLTVEVSNHRPTTADFNATLLGLV